MNKKAIFKFLLSYLKEAKLLLLASFITTLIYSFCTAYIPEIPAKVIDQDIKNIPNLSQFLFNNAMLLLGVVIVFSIAIYARYLLFNALANKVSMRMQIDLAAHLLALKMNNFDEILAGDITSRFCRDINRTRYIYELALPAIMDSVVLITVLYVRLGFLNIYICAIGLIYFPLIYLLGKLFLRTTVPHIKNYMTHIGEMSGFLNESIKSMESIQSFGKEEEVSKQFDIRSKGIYQEYRSNLFFTGFFSWNIVVRMRHLVDILLLVVFGMLYFKGIKAPIGALFIATAYNGRVFKHFLNVFMQLSTIQNAFVTSSRVCQLMNLEHERNDGKEIRIEEGKVEFKNVSFEYKKGVPVLHDISFVVHKGETIAFIGKTGCGKSTLMNLLLGFYEIRTGDILIDSNNIKEMSLNSLRNAIAIVLQEPYLFEGTIFENIAMGRKETTKEDAIRYLEAVGGKNIIERDANGIMQNVIENGKNFSHGERQIICFARALSFNPKILILDEATSNIDIETERLITRGIEVLKKGRTTLIIAHRLETIKHVDMVYHIKDGTIIEKGKFEQIKEYEMN
ncbi:MAG: ABC transporter ATP-binding protein [Treponema sp.]